MALILVTGGCGFIGINLVEKLVQEGHSVRVLDNNAYSAVSMLPEGVEFIEGSASDPVILAEAFRGVARCVHLAGTSVLKDPRQEQVESIQPFMASVEPLFMAAHAAGAGVVYASSAAVYGETRTTPIREDAPLLPISAHGMEKLALETCASTYAEKGVASLGLRMFNVFGPGQNPKSPYCGVVRKFADQLLSGTPVTIHGDGSQKRDFVFVDDATDCIVKTIAAPLSGADVVNVCSGEPVTVKDVVSALERVFNRRFVITYKEAAKTMISASVGDPAKGRRAFGFRPFLPFSDAVEFMAQNAGA